MINPNEAYFKSMISMYKGDDGKTVFDVLNKDGDPVKKFSDEAMEFDFELRKGEVHLKNQKCQVTMAKWHTEEDKVVNKKFYKKFPWMMNRHQARWSGSRRFPQDD